MSFADAVARALRTAKNLTGLEVVYRRGSDAVPLKATKTRPAVDQDRAEGVTIDADAADWLIEAADLVIDGKRTKPAERDLIEYLAGSVKETYRVMPTTGESHYEPVDPWNLSWRVHTKLVQRDE